MGQQYWPGEDFGYQIDWSGTRLCKPRTLTRNEVKKIGSDKFNPYGLCVYCRSCGEYMDYTEDDDDVAFFCFECFSCRKKFSDDQITDHYNKNPGPSYEELYGDD
jgi:hypothetical protein